MRLDAADSGKEEAKEETTEEPPCEQAGGRAATIEEMFSFGDGTMVEGSLAAGSLQEPVPTPPSLAQPVSAGVTIDCHQGTANKRSRRASTPPHTSNRTDNRTTATRTKTRTTPTDDSKART